MSYENIKDNLPCNLYKIHQLMNYLYGNMNFIK